VACALAGFAVSLRRAGCDPPRGTDRRPVSSHMAKKRPGFFSFHLSGVGKRVLWVRMIWKG
jgi:hypothetical protein